jgi:TonB family protein
MNAYVNYLLEANLGLGIFLLAYTLFLRTETDFRIKRGFLVTGMISSTLFPLLHISTTEKILPALADYIPTTWLPEFVVTGQGSAAAGTQSNFDLWMSINLVYCAGLIMMLGLFLIRLFMLLKLIARSAATRYNRFLVAESSENRSSFSFFRFIFIGQADKLSADEKQQIIDHEAVHVRQYHSLDILSLQVLRIFFWFNPLLRIYKKTLVQLHEFEADARAVRNRDVDNYCSLLAKVALLSADFTLANHFSNSLTVKRIEMMRSIKNKIRPWKMAALAAVVPLVFFLLSCQDQLMADTQELVQTSSIALDIPAEVQAQVDQIKATKPEQKFVVIETTTAEGKASLEKIKNNEITSMHVIKPTAEPGQLARSFVVLEYNDNVRQFDDAINNKDEVYTVVEESATFKGGLEALGRFLGENLQYPTEARRAGTQGAVFVSMIINKDGSVSDVGIVQGVDPLLDKEAVRVVMLSPNWIPGKQNGKLVRQRFVLPVKFKLG